MEWLIVFNYFPSCFFILRLNFKISAITFFNRIKFQDVLNLKLFVGFVEFKFGYYFVARILKFNLKINYI